MLIATKPGANPITGFPAGAATVAGDSRPHNVSVKHDRTAYATAAAPTEGFVLESTAFEAGGAASKVMGPAASHGAVPVTWTNIGAGGEAESRHSSTAETTKV